MIDDFLIRLSSLTTNGVINNSEYSAIYDILMKAKDRQTLSTFEEIANKLNEKYKDKLVYEQVGYYHCFGYPKFEAKTDRICLYCRPYYSYFKGDRSIESRFKNFHYTTLWENECDERIKPVTLKEMEEILKTFEGVNVEYVLNKFKDDPRR